MADIRIKDLATTAASTASDDFIAVDGSANGTRKLNAYSPTFGGNLTVSGTGGITSTAPSPLFRGSTSVLGGVPKLTLENTNNGAWSVYLSATDGGDFKIDQDSTNKFRIAYGTGNATLSGNLTVSGGTVTGGTSGLTLQAAGTNQNVALTPSGTGIVTIGGAARTIAAAAGSLTIQAPANIFFNSNGANEAGRFLATGNFLLGTTTDAASGARLQAQLTGTDGTVSTLLSLRKNTNGAGTGVAIDFTPDSTDNPLAKLSAVRTSLANGYTDFRFSTWSGSALVEQLRLVGQTGNFLVGTTTDGGNGKLQLATHTTSAGGIGFGTADSLYTAGVGDFRLKTTSAEAAITLLSGGAYIGSVTAGKSTFIVSGGGTTALTLDSSQNATFAGDIRFTSTNTFDIGETGTRVRVAYIKTLVLTSVAPATASSTGTTGTVTWDADYLYVCTATNTWKRVAIATW